MSRLATLLTFRRLAALPLAALTVHWLRYELAFGGRTGHELAITGHAYLGSVTPWAILAAVAAIGASAAWIRRGLEPPVRMSTRRAWLTLSAVLVGIFVAQELLEGLLAAGHPPGFAGVFGNGGLWAVPAAFAVAGLLVLGRRGERTLAALLHRGARERVARAVATRLPRPAEADAPAAAPLTTVAAGRAPPRRPLAAVA